jgi:hypothetical protein
MRRFAVLTATIFFAAISNATQAAQPNLTIDAFFGSFSGGGISANEDSIYFATTARNFDVKIAPAANGFKIDWTSVIRRRQSSKTLRPTDNTRAFHCNSSSDPLKG